MKIVRREKRDTSALASIEDPILRELLSSRGVRNMTDASCELKDLLHYRDLPDIDKASKIIADTIENSGKILIFGDYDVDGMTGTALGVRALQALGLPAENITCKVPSRYDGGYGLSVSEVEKAKLSDINLILTVDNGICCTEAADKALELGIKLVITDHHECPEQLPSALAIVDPKLPGSLFPSTALCGAGVLFYVLSAVRAELELRNFYQERKKPVMADFLDLVTLGTIGDVVAFDPNNRRLVRAGLSRMQTGRTLPGIIALAAHSRCDLNEVNPHSIGFELCPRLNAAGRIKLSDNPALDLLLTDDPQKADELSLRLDMCNRRRGDFERVALKEAREEATRTDVSGALVLFKEHWLSGITGLLAGRLKEEYGVPCFVFSGEGSLIKGSARSIPGVPLGKILRRMQDEHPKILYAGGGHAMAAGATIIKERFEEFINCFKEYCTEYMRSPLEEEIYTDGLLDEAHINLDFARLLERSGPWGEGFPEPLFDGKFEVISIVPIQNRHLRFSLRSASGKILHAVKFRAGIREKALTEGMDVQAVFALEVNRYKGRESLQIRLEMVEPA